jgi:acyl-CoA reductase-like NAD-dependent aldehyde dehydrogenase
LPHVTRDRPSPCLRASSSIVRLTPRLEQQPALSSATPRRSLVARSIEDYREVVMAEHGEVIPLRIGALRPEGDGTIEVRSPYDGDLIGTVAAAGAEDLDAAVAAARSALASGPLPAHRRAEILDVAAGLAAERTEELARIICQEAAKPIRHARVEAQRAADTLRFSATAARTLTGETVPLEASAAGVGKIGFVLRFPIGVVAAITPFNFPLNLVLHKLGPAVAAGCPVVLKPASSTPLSAHAAADIFEEAGLPPGWINVVPCSGRVAQHLVEHPDVAMITFTGSREVGWAIRAAAPKKKVSLELGNNSPLIIEPDGDWRSAAAKIRVAGYSHAGQSCISTQRVYVHKDVADDFSELLAGEVGSIVVGDPSDEATEVSSLISPKDGERVRSWVGEALAGGARLLAGGDPDGSSGGVVRPTLLADVTADMKVCSAEVFGPVVSVLTYTDLADALAQANDSEYGLQAAIFTSDLGAAMRAARTLDYGTVLINEVPTWRADQMPYGGVRDSGNTREGPAYAVREMTEPRLIVLPSG